MKKVLSTLMIMVMLACISTTVFANQVNTGFIDGLNPNYTLTTDANDTMQKVGSTILTLVTNAGMILAVVVIAIVGVKYMLGSVEEKAEYKKVMMPYLIGAILVFGASAIGKLVVGIGASIVK